MKWAHHNCGFGRTLSHYVSSLIMVTPTSIEGELPEERLFRKYSHKIRNWDDENKISFRKASLS